MVRCRTTWRLLERAFLIGVGESIRLPKVQRLADGSPRTVEIAMSSRMERAFDDLEAVQGGSRYQGSGSLSGEEQPFQADRKVGHDRVQLFLFVAVRAL